MFIIYFYCYCYCYFLVILDVGTAITCSGEVDVFAFAAMVPTNRVTRHALLTPLHTQLVGLLSQPNSTLSATHIMRTSDWDSRTGLFVHRKFVNLPLPLITPLHRNLEEDLVWATGSGLQSTESSSSSRVWNGFHTLILMAPCSLTSGTSDGKKGSSTKSSTVPEWRTRLHEGQAVAYQSGTMKECIEFDYFEDEIFCQLAVDLLHAPVKSSVAQASSGGAFLRKSKETGDKLVMTCFLTLDAYKRGIQEIAKLAT